MALDIAIGLRPVKGGRKDVVLVLQLGDGVSCVQWQLDPNSARRVAAMLTTKANEAECPIIAPAFDSAALPRG